MHTTYHDNSCCLLLEVLQPILVGLPLSVPPLLSPPLPSPYHAHTYHDNSCCLLPEVLQPILVGLPLLVPFPMGLKLHSLCFMCTKVFHPLAERSSHQSPPPVGLQLDNQWLVGFHQCPAVIVSRHFGHHSLGDRRGRE